MKDFNCVTSSDTEKGEALEGVVSVTHISKSNFLHLFHCCFTGSILISPIVLTSYLQ